MSKQIIETYMAKLGPETFWRYVEWNYNKIRLMHSGESFKIKDNCSEEMEPLYMEVLKSFAIMHYGEYLFSNDYTEFIKQDVHQLEETRKIREKAHRKNEHRRDGEGTGSNGIRSETIHTPGADISNTAQISKSRIRNNQNKIRAS